MGGRICIEALVDVEIAECCVLCCCLGGGGGNAYYDPASQYQYQYQQQGAYYYGGSGPAPGYNPRLDNNYRHHHGLPLLSPPPQQQGYPGSIPEGYLGAIPQGRYGDPVPLFENLSQPPPYAFGPSHAPPPPPQPWYDGASAPPLVLDGELSPSTAYLSNAALPPLASAVVLDALPPSHSVTVVRTGSGAQVGLPTTILAPQPSVGFVVMTHGLGSKNPKAKTHLNDDWLTVTILLFLFMRNRQ